LDPTWTTGDLSVSQCLHCVHWRSRGSCAAFPQGIPAEILLNESDHEKPFTGDGGVRFSRRNA
jgi:hypothetical protein